MGNDKILPFSKHVQHILLRKRKTHLHTEKGKCQTTQKLRHFFCANKIQENKYKKINV